jgi:hypothetical protein
MTDILGMQTGILLGVLIYIIVIALYIIVCYLGIIKPALEDIERQKEIDYEEIPEGISAKQH